MNPERWVEEFLCWDPDVQQNALELLLRSSFEARKHAKELLYKGDGNGFSLRGPVVNRPRAPSIVPTVDFLECLPSHICANILWYLDMASLARASGVSLRWRKKCSANTADEIWQSEFLRLHPNSTYIENIKSVRATTWRDLCYLQGRSRLGWMEKSISKNVYTGHKDRVRHVRIRANTFVSSSWDRTLRVVNLSVESSQHGGHSKQVASHGGSVFGVWFDGRVAVTCSEDSTIKIWHVFEGKCVAELYGHTTAVYRVAMISQSEILVSCSKDFIGVWHWPSATLLHKLVGHNHDVHRIQVSDKVIVTGSYDCTIRVWRYPTCESLWVSPACHKSGVSCLHFEGNVLATGSAKGGVFVWDLESGLRKFAFDGSHHNNSTISCILVSSSRVFSTSNLSLRQSDGIVCIWDCDTGTLVQKLVESFHINSLRVDFGLIFCACSDGKLRIRLLKRGNDFVVVRELEHGSKPLYDVDVQGPRAVTCGLDKTVVLWSVDLLLLEQELS